jgi:transposase
MEVVHPRCAGIDVSKKDAKVCVRVAGAGRRKASSTVTTWGAVTNQVLALRDHLIEAKVTLVVMEATSDYAHQGAHRPLQRAPRLLGPRAS